MNKPLPFWAKGFPNKGLPRLKLAYQESNKAYKVDLTSIFEFDPKDKIYGADVVQFTQTMEGQEKELAYRRFLVTCDERPMYDEIMFEIYDPEGNQLQTSYLTEFRKTRMTMYAPAFNKPVEAIKTVICGRSSN